MSFSVASYAKVGRLLTYETRENKEMNKRSLIVGCVLLSVLGFSSVSYSDNHDVLERYVLRLRITDPESLRIS